ncbi:MAG: DUF5060 domain-containing protein [Anaerolineales bacterium]|nr:DUF5060 domain-containing protein [Anaerolineales bacterium]
MNTRLRITIPLLGLAASLILLVASCGRGKPPAISAVEPNRTEVPRYESLELTVTLEAEYTNPYDAREVTLDGVFTAPDGSSMPIPGFWDGKESWLLRFTPWLEGRWTYQLTVTDANGTSAPAEGGFTVTGSDLHGWLLPGNQVNPVYSGHYLVYHDGTPFYGLGYCEALNILIDGFDAEEGVRLFDNMVAEGANFVVWWPLYTNSPISSSYDQYSAANMTVIDMVVADAQANGIFLVFTIWDHPELRAPGHPWGNGNWPGRNGFSNLNDGDIATFFTSEESWAWQANFYRYLIARWGYSPAIGMWQTVSEINGTNAYDQTDPWHARVNDYFVANDPYRHPTTASMSGDVAWPGGHAVMDAPQVHVYDLEDPIEAAETISYWTGEMWAFGEKPNWIGEFGVPGNLVYPEMYHNALWAALASGAALTPAEWNSGGSWGRMTAEMNADLERLGRFVADLPLARMDPSPLLIGSRNPQVRAWGLAGENSGLFWVQDFALQGSPIDVIRADGRIREGVQLEIRGLAGGTYVIKPYDTWRGQYLASFEVVCREAQTCTLTLPNFHNDLAFKLDRK